MHHLTGRCAAAPAADRQAGARLRAGPGAGGYGHQMGFIPAGAAVRSSARLRWAMGALAAAVVAADQVSKSLVLAAGPDVSGGSGWVSVQLVRNSGSAGGFFARYPVLVTLAAIAVTVIAAVVALRARGRGVALCLAAVLGGAAGNLSDRLLRGPGLGRGGVVDWIHFASRGGSMNVADIAIQLGALGALIALVAGDRVRNGRAARRPSRPGREAGAPENGCS